MDKIDPWEKNGIRINIQKMFQELSYSRGESNYTFTALATLNMHFYDLSSALCIDFG